MTAAAQPWIQGAQELTSLLHLDEPPIAITWCGEAPDGVAAFDDPMPEPTPDGRTGRVSAPCVFWVRSTDRSFSTVEDDHANCSVGLVTHGWRSMEDVAGNGDVAALLESGWVTEAMVPQIPAVSEKPGAIVYGPLAEVGTAPNVVLIRLNARQMMVLSDALPGLRIEGKPQCHILAIAKEQGEVAASVGCMLSRVRTGMRADEMTCAIPGSKLDDVIAALRVTNDADTCVARYASEDASRFEVP